MEEVIYVDFNSSVSLKPINDEFTLAKCSIMALGNNRNGSHFSKESVDKAIATITNIPVIANLKKDINGSYKIGGHDSEIIRNKDGEYVEKSICTPFGVVPYNNNFYYKDVVEPDGTTKTYLYGDVILWTGRFPELLEAKYSDDIMFGESMEIRVKDFDTTEDGYFDIKDFSFSALCLLQKSDGNDHVEPCFPMSNVSVGYSLANNNEFQKLFEEFNSKVLELDIFKEGVEKEMETEKQKEDIEEVDINIEPVENTEEKIEEDEKPSFSKVSAIKEYCKELSNNEVEFVVDSINSDTVYIKEFSVTDDEYSCVGVKEYKYFVNDEEVKLSSEYSLAYSILMSESEYNSYKEMKENYQALVDFKKGIEVKEHHQKIDNVLNEFDDLYEIQDFKSLRECAYEYEDIEMLRDKCFAIRGKNIDVSKKSKSNLDNAVRVIIPDENKTNSRYGDIFSIYGKK